MMNVKKLMLYYGACAVRYLLETLAVFVSLLFSPKRCALPPIKERILLMPAVELSQKVKSGELTSEQVLETYIDRIKQVNPVINAVVDFRFDQALELARKIDKKLAAAREGAGDKTLLDLELIGVPLTVKETIPIEGSAFTFGLPQRRHKRAAITCEGVANLIESGLIPIGSTNIPCQSMWWAADNLVYGRTHNPYDLSRTAGGSSGGEGAILGAAGSVVGVGSDLGGSIRIPANFNGVFGHFPTPGCVPHFGATPKLREEQGKMAAIGPMARYASDLLPMLKIMISKEAESKLQLDRQVNLKQLKIYYCEDLGDPSVAECNSDILAGLRAAVEHLSSAHGIPVQMVRLEEFKYGIQLWLAELTVRDGWIRTEEHEDGRIHMNVMLELCKKLVNASDFTINTIAAEFFETIAFKYGSSRHLFLSGKAADLRRRFYELVGDNGVLLIPTHPQPAPYHHTTLLRLTNTAYTAVCNVLRSPITQCPLGMTREGLPFGLQAIAKPFNDRLTLAVARELESVFGGWQSPSRVAA